MNVLKLSIRGTETILGMRGHSGVYLQIKKELYSSSFNLRYRAA